MPLISIVLTSYNREVLLERSIKSVLNQTFDDFELIIVDDCSKVSTLNVLKKYENNSKIKVIYNSENRGANYCRNKGIEFASGKYYTGIDDDDYFAENRLDRLIEDFDEKYSFICDNYIVFDGNKYKPRFGCEKDIDYLQLCFSNHAGNQIFTLTDRVKAIGGFDINLRRLQDQDTWLRLSYEYGKAKRINAKTYIMDVSHEMNRITSSVSTHDAYEKFLFKHQSKMNKKEINLNEMRLSYLSGKTIDMPILSIFNILYYFKCNIKKLKE